MYTISFSGHNTVWERVSNKNIELLVVSCRPDYLPHEISIIIVLVVYIPPSVNAKHATYTISNSFITYKVDHLTHWPLLTGTSTSADLWKGMNLITGYGPL